MAMLTPGKIKGYQFQPAGRGTYKAEEVDDFLAQVVESYEQVFRENGELVQKLRLLVKKLNDIKKEESNISKVLVNAQTFIDKMIDEAKKEAKTIVSDAEERAKNVDSITNAKIKVMVDEVEGKMRLAYEKAMAQAKSTKDSAYKEAEILILEAKEKAEKIISDAEATASALISDATKDAEKEAAALKEEIEREKELLDSLKETSNQFKTELVVLYERQLKSVEQMPDYVLDKELEEKVKKIIEEKDNEEEAAGKPETDESTVEKIVDTFVASEDDFFDADDLIREYAGTADSDDEGFSFDFDDASQDSKASSVDDFFSFEDIGMKTEEAETEVSEDVKAEEKAEDIFSSGLSDEDIEKLEKEAEEAVGKEIDEEIKAKEAEIEAEIEKDMSEDGFVFDFSEAESEDEISEEADEYEDIFSDSGEGEGFRFTAEDFEEIKSSEKAEEAAFEFRTEDVDLFSEETAKNDIPVSRPERRRQVDISISENTAAEVDKDESLFLARDEKVEKEDTGFKFFDDIDASDDDFHAEDEGVDADDIFGKKDDDDDDDSDGFSFLKNIFGKNNN